MKCNALFTGMKCFSLYTPPSLLPTLSWCLLLQGERCLGVRPRFTDCFKLCYLWYYHVMWNQVFAFSLFGSYVWIAMYVWMLSWICSVSTYSSTGTEFPSSCVTWLGLATREICTVFGRWKFKQLPLLCLGVRVRSDTVATHACYRQTDGSHCWYAVAGVPALSRSLFSASLTTESVGLQVFRAWKLEA